MIPEPAHEERQQEHKGSKVKSIGVGLAAVAAVALLLGGIRLCINYQFEQDLNQQVEEWSQPATYASTPTRAPRPTRTPRPTATPLQPVSVNSDCIGCDVAMPREVVAPSLALHSYGAPGKVLLVTCSKGYSVDGNLVMGPLRSSHTTRNIVVQDLQIEDADHDDGCVAITAIYVGTEVYSQARSTRPQSSRRDVSILTFKVAGEVTRLTASQYNTMKQYAAIAR